MAGGRHNTDCSKRSRAHAIVAKSENNNDICLRLYHTPEKIRAGKINTAAANLVLNLS